MADNQHRAGDTIFSYGLLYRVIELGGSGEALAERTYGVHNRKAEKLHNRRIAQRVVASDTHTTQAQAPQAGRELLGRPYTLLACGRESFTTVEINQKDITPST